MAAERSSRDPLFGSSGLRERRARREARKMRVLVSAMPVSRPAVATSRAELRPVPGLGREGRADQAAVKPCNPWQPDPAYDARAAPAAPDRGRPGERGRTASKKTLNLDN